MPIASYLSIYLSIYRYTVYTLKNQIYIYIYVFNLEIRVLDVIRDPFQEEMPAELLAEQEVEPKLANLISETWPNLSWPGCAGHDPVLLPPGWMPFVIFRVVPPEQLSNLKEYTLPAFQGRSYVLRCPNGWFIAGTPLPGAIAGHHFEASLGTGPWQPIFGRAGQR